MIYLEIPRDLNALVTWNLICQNFYLSLSYDEDNENEIFAVFKIRKGMGWEILFYI